MFCFFSLSVSFFRSSFVSSDKSPIADTLHFPHVPFPPQGMGKLVPALISMSDSKAFPEKVCSILLFMIALNMIFLPFIVIYNVIIMIKYE